MLDFSVSLVPLIVIALANFFMSWLWYSNALFAKPWMKALGVPAEHVMSDKEKKEMPILFISGLVASFILSYVLQILTHSLGAMTFAQGLLVGLVTWIGFALTHSLNTLWEGRSKTVLLINNGLYILTYAVFGGIVAVRR